MWGKRLRTIIGFGAIGNKTKWYFHTNALIREFVANMNIERKKHIEKMTVLVLILIVLLMVSYQFKIM